MICEYQEISTKDSMMQESTLELDRDPGKALEDLKPGHPDVRSRRQLMAENIMAQLNHVHKMVQDRPFSKHDLENLMAEHYLSLHERNHWFCPKVDAPLPKQKLSTLEIMFQIFKPGRLHYPGR